MENVKRLEGRAPKKYSFMTLKEFSLHAVDLSSEKTGNGRFRVACLTLIYHPDSADKLFIQAWPDCRVVPVR